MDTREKTLGKHNSGLRMSPRSQQQVYFDENRPRDNDLSPQSSEQLGGKAMPTTLAAIDRGD